MIVGGHIDDLGTVRLARRRARDVFLLEDVAFIVFHEYFPLDIADDGSLEHQTVAVIAYSLEQRREPQPQYDGNEVASESGVQQSV